MSPIEGPKVFASTGTSSGPIAHIAIVVLCQMIGCWQHALRLRDGDLTRRYSSANETDFDSAACRVKTESANARSWGQTGGASPIIASLDALLAVL
jgi:hypothetical protein